jgi:4'-phosphopantetheinyl transferase
MWRRDSAFDASGRFPAWPFPGRETHVWVVNLDDHVDGPDTASLSRDERERASRMRKHRELWMTSRSLLRQVLGGCLGREPRQIEFRMGPNDKPELVWSDGGPAPHFNLSHSGKMALIAVGAAPIGVDVEQVRDMPDLWEVARHALRPDEVAALRALPSPRLAEAFTSVWTRKEAYLKARGLGIGGMQRVSVSVDPDAPAVLLGADEGPEVAARWTLVDLAVGPDYRAALAVLGDSTIVRRTLGRTGDSEG